MKRYDWFQYKLMESRIMANKPIQESTVDEFLWQLVKTTKMRYNYNVKISFESSKSKRLIRMLLSNSNISTNIANACKELILGKSKVLICANPVLREYGNQITNG